MRVGFRASAVAFALMTAAVTLMAKARGGPRIHQQLLFYPVTDASFDTESYHHYVTRQVM